MTLAIASASNAAANTGRRIRVMLVDDAVVVRALFARWVEAESDLELVASLRTGREAVNQLERANPDVVVLDVEMPELDGIAALPLLLQKRRDLVVIMASTVTRRNAEISLKALSLGAADYIAKPGGSREVNASLAFRRDLIEKIRQLGLRARRFRQPLAREGAFAPSKPTSSSVRPPARPPARSPACAARLAADAGHAAARAADRLVHRRLRRRSTSCAPQIGGVIERAPVLVTQHMPPTFTAILAEHIARIAKCPVREAKDGEEVNAGAIYLAPGGKHMTVARRDGVAVIVIEDGPPVNFCKPAVDPLFSSAAAVWGSKALALVLTGMGADGLAGAREIVAAGGHVLAQDEASSVVWGMPGQVAHAGLCSAVLPLSEIAPKLNRLFGGERV